MPKVICSCGARYRFEDSAIGRRATCKRCGESFVVRAEPDSQVSDEVPQEDGEIRLSPLLDSFAELDTDDAPYTPVELQQRAAYEGLANAHMPSLPDANPVIANEAISSRVRGACGYVRSIFASLLYISDPGSLATFLALWFCVVAATVVPVFRFCFGTMASIVFMGWYYAFCIETVAHAAAGDDALPRMTLEDGWWDGIIFPLVRWIGVWFVVVGPGYACYHLSAMAGLVADGGVPPAFSFLALLLTGVPGVIVLFADFPVAVVLLLLGQLAWPMLILCVALGGFTTLYRPDLMIITFARTLPVYLVTVVLVNLHLLGQYLILANMPPVTSWTGLAWLFLFLLGAGVYFNLFAMRAIGLYYHHFKHRFAWNWG